MKMLGALLLNFAAAAASAATAYVSDELVLGVYAEQNGQGQRLTTLHSGASVETLAVDGEFTGWVKSAYLMTKEPATARVKQLEEELDRSRATTPALAEAAARSEVDQLKHQLADTQAELASARAAAPGGAPAAAGTATGDPGLPAAITAATSSRGLLAALLPLALACGFWLGYATLARRIKHKFGGLKVY
jgi:phage protein D